MNPTRKTATNWLLGVLVSVLSFNVTAQTTGDPNKYSTTPGNPACRFFDGYADNGDGTVTDPRNGLVWKRCAEGFTWSGVACDGDTKRMSWKDAMQHAKSHSYLNKKDWRLPTAKELQDVVGVFDTKASKSCNQNPKGEFATSTSISHIIQKENGLPGFFWTSTRFDDNAVRVGFYVGDATEPKISFPLDVRLVRSIDARSKAGKIEYDREFSSLLSEVERERRDQAVREAKEREENRRREAYANSPAGRADAQRQQQARQVCEAQKQTCKASCPAYNYDAKSFDANRTHFQCESRCSQISCN